MDDLRARVKARAANLKRQREQSNFDKRQVSDELIKATVTGLSIVRIQPLERPNIYELFLSNGLAIVAEIYPEDIKDANRQSL